MASLNPMPPIKIDVERLAPFGQEWLQNGGALGRTPPLSSSDAHVPEPSSLLRIERFSEQIEMAYSGRYKGLPPHAG